MKYADSSLSASLSLSLIVIQPIRLQAVRSGHQFFLLPSSPPQQTLQPPSPSAQFLPGWLKRPLSLVMLIFSDRPEALSSALTYIQDAVSINLKCNFNFRGYGVISKLLTEMLKKDGFQWTDAAKQAFDQLKNALCHPPVLALPNFQKEFVVEADASYRGMSAVLI
nr:disease resistance protein [Ipomoea batatas]